MSMALQQEVTRLRENTESLTAQVTKLHSQLIIEQTKRSELSQRLATLESLVANHVPKASAHGNRKATVR